MRPPRSRHPTSPMSVAWATLALLLGAGTAAAQSEPTPADPLSAPALLETVVVTGAQPGPGLWRVSKDAHVLWILGTLTPLPKKMQWLSREVEDTIAQSQEVVLGPTANLSVDGGMVAGLFLLPSLLSARNNPDGQTLAQVLPADLYPRWQALKQRYLPHDRGVDKRRPLFAAQELYEKAIERAGLTLDPIVKPVVTKAAKRSKVPVTQPELKLKIEKPRAAVKEFKKAPLDDIACLRLTIERIENDLDAMKARANAWASGDLQALRELPYTDQRPACEDAFLAAGAARSHGLDDVKPRLRQLWLEAAEAALAKNASSFATLPIGQLLDEDGLLAALRAKGYEVENP